MFLETLISNTLVKYASFKSITLVTSRLYNKQNTELFPSL